MSSPSEPRLGSLEATLNQLRQEVRVCRGSTRRAAGGKMRKRRGGIRAGGDEGPGDQHAGG